MGKKKIRIFHKLRERNVNLVTAFIVIGVMAAVGIYLYPNSHAASPYASTEAESGTLLGNSTIFNDSSASNSSAVQFGGNYTFDDEFNGPAGSAPNPALWQNNVGNGSDGWGNQQLDYDTDGNANSYLDGQGDLVIEADKYTGSTYQCWNGTCQFTSARLITASAFSQAYGQFSARIEMPDLQSGLWPAFWMLGNNINSVGWPECGEIDVMENYGSDLIEGSMHGPVPANDTHADYDLTSSNATSWHVYSIDWTPTQVSFSIDGQVYGTTTASQMGGDWVFDHPFFIILDMAVGGVATNNVAPSNVPAKMLVDYVRVTN